MEGEAVEGASKRMRSAMEEVDEKAGDATTQLVEYETETNVAGSEEMELSIAHILEKIEHFTQMVSELLESGKAALKELSDEFEEQMILIHKEQVEKWQEEIKGLRILDASNEEVNALLHNARHLVHNLQISS